MAFTIIQCRSLECNKYMSAVSDSKTKKCPYCGKRNLVAENIINSTEDRLKAKMIVQKLNASLT